MARTGGVVVGCLYLPSGSSSEARQKVKDQMLEELPRGLNHGKSQAVCLAGDFNVAPTERDIFHWKSNQKTVVFYMNAGSPTCCNADGTTPCVSKRVNATARTPGGRTWASSSGTWIGDVADRPLAPQRQPNYRCSRPIVHKG